MPTLQAVLPCLLLLNQATTNTNVVSREGQGPPGPQSCSPGEYWIVGRCCKACPAGQHIGEHCRRSHSWGQCVPCPPGTFMNCLNGMEACFKCSACSKNEDVLEECTPTHDRVCQCRSGYFYAHEGSSESCSPCSTCPAGHVVVRSCNTTADTVCGLPAPERRHRYSLLGSFAFVLVVKSLCFWVRKQAGLPNGGAECMELVSVVPGRGRVSSLSQSSEFHANRPGSPCLPTTEPSNACAFPALDSAGATGPELEKSLIHFTTGFGAAQRPCVLVKLPQNSVSSMPSNEDGSAESSVPTRGNLNQPEDSVDIPTEAPAITRALQSLADVNGPQAVAGEGARAPEWSPQPGHRQTRRDG